MMVTLIQQRGTSLRSGFSLISVYVFQALEGHGSVPVDTCRRPSSPPAFAKPLGACDLPSQPLSLLQAETTWTDCVRLGRGG